MTEENFQQVNIEDLVPGMFVNSVLEQTGQLRIKTKGLVKTWDVIEKLQLKGIKLLEVDPARSNQKEIDKHTQKDVEEAESPPAAPIMREKTEGEALNDAQKLYDKAKLGHKRFLKKMPVSYTHLTLPTNA
mgnify:CR=1 FL=1